MMEDYIILRVNVDYPKLLLNDKEIDYDDYELLGIYTTNIELIEKKTNKTIGYLIGKYIDLDYIYNNEISVLDVFELDGDIFGIYETLFEDGILKEEYEAIFGNIFYIHRIYINKEYRNNGYAKMLLNNLNNIITNILKYNVGIIVVYPSAFEDNDQFIKDRNINNKLISLYESCGFNKIDDSNYFIKIVNNLY